MIGDELLAGRYALSGLLGRGGMAEVREGWDTVLDRPVAVKLLHETYAGRPEAHRRFVAEARAAAALSHPNVVAVHDFGEQEGTPFLVMERLSGETLGDRMAGGAMSPHQVRSILDQVLAALQAAHHAGVLHRDIKPDNILLAPEGVKVADFGIAKTGSSAATTTGHLVGTMAYMSPDRVVGSPASPADDLYAVGIVGYEALVGRPIYPHDNPAAVAYAITSAGLPNVATQRADVDAVTADVIDRAVSHDPRRRFATAEQMRAALTGRPALAVGVGPAVRAAPKPGTKVLDRPLPPVTAAGGWRPPEKRVTTVKYATAAAILLAFVVAVAALAMDPFSSSHSPEPVSTSSPVAPPPTTEPPTPSNIPTTSAPEPSPTQKPKEKKEKGNRGEGNDGDPGNGRPRGGGDDEDD